MSGKTLTANASAAALPGPSGALALRQARDLGAQLFALVVGVHERNEEIDAPHISGRIHLDEAIELDGFAFEVIAASPPTRRRFFIRGSIFLTTASRGTKPRFSPASTICLVVSRRSGDFGGGAKSSNDPKSGPLLSGDMRSLLHLSGARGAHPCDDFVCESLRVADRCFDAGNGLGVQLGKRQAIAENSAEAARWTICVWKTGTLLVSSVLSTARKSRDCTAAETRVRTHAGGNVAAADADGVSHKRDCARRLS